MNLNDILKKEDIQNFHLDITKMSSSKLRKIFRFKNSRKINSTKLIKNIVWQTYTWISIGRMEPIEGNVRSLWYRRIKSVLSRLNFKVGERYVRKLYDILTEMVAVHRLFRYVDFGFVDERIYHRTIGTKNSNIILFVEKDGLFPIVRRIAKKYGVTAISLKGFPSYLTTEFLIRDMGRSVANPFHLIGLVDYDPSGYWIAKEFVEQLENYGVNIASCESLFEPSKLSLEIIELSKYSLGDKSSRNKNWLKATNGVNGEAYGLEADALNSKDIRKLFSDAIENKIQAINHRSLLFRDNLDIDWVEWLLDSPHFIANQ